MPVSTTASGTGIHLKLLISGLLGPTATATDLDPFSGLSTPGLQSLLARSDRLNGMAHADLEEVVFQLFNIGVEQDKDLPIAAVTRVLDLGVIDNGWWLRADPVHLRADHDRLILADGTVLHITQDEADRLVKEVMEMYAEDGWVLKAAQPDRWYIKPPHEPHIRTAPLPVVIGRDVREFLPTGEDRKAWHTLLNEIQILLHTASVNGEREHRGELPINSVWFWGGGRLPELKHVRWSKVWSAEPVSLALARLSETPWAAVPANADDWLQLAEVPGEHLVVLDGSRRCLQYDDIAGWHTFMLGLETEWVVPLLKALKAKAIESVTFYTEAGRGFRLTPKALRRWWRRRRPLSKYCK